jgi:hypothetical protein
MRAMVARQRLGVASEDRPDTGDSAALPSRAPSAPHELKVIELPRFEPLERGSDSMAAMQEWEGVVTAVEDDIVHADLIDVTAGHQHVSETAEFPLSEFDLPDRARVRRGTIFRWAIGYVRTEAGTRFGASVLRLRHATRTTAALARPLAFETD